MAANSRGILLLLVAFVIGIAILQSTDPGTGSPAPTAAKTKTSTTKAGRSPTTTVPVTTTVPARPPGEVKLLPVNGSGLAGIGAKTGDKLKAAGYNTLAATNTKDNALIPATAVEFAPGYGAEAQAVATALGLQAAAVKPLESPPVDDTREASVVVLIGPDLASLLGGASATTTTTR